MFWKWKLWGKKTMGEEICRRQLLGVNIREFSDNEHSWRNPRIWNSMTFKIHNLFVRVSEVCNTLKYGLALVMVQFTPPVLRLRENEMSHMFFTFDDFFLRCIESVILVLIFPKITSWNNLLCFFSDVGKNLKRKLMSQSVFAGKG